MNMLTVPATGEHLKAKSQLSEARQSPDGTSQFAGIKGGGMFKIRLISPMEVECTWQGRYELALAAEAA